MVIRYLLVAFFLLQLIRISGAKNQEAIDSLRAVIESSAPDTSRVKAYMGLANLVARHEIDTVITYYFKALSLIDSVFDESGIAEKESLEKSKALSLYKLGLMYRVTGNIAKCLEYYHLALAIHELNQNKKEVATMLSSIARVYQILDDLETALDYFNRALKIREKQGNRKGVAYSCNNIAYVLIKMDKVDAALKYFKRALKIRQGLGIMNEIAGSMSKLGLIYSTKGDYEMSLKYHLKSNEISTGIGHKKIMGISLNHIGNMYRNLGDTLLALEYYHRSIEVKKEMGNKGGIAYSLHNIGKIALAKGNLMEAKHNADMEMQIVLELGFPNRINTASYFLSKVHRAMGDYEKALTMYEMHIKMRDSVNNEETQKAAIRQQTKYEFEKVQLVKEQKEKEQARIEAEVTSRRDNLQYSVILIALLVLFSGVLSLGFVKVNPRMAEGIIFFSFLILFEFLLVLADPYIEEWSGGAPGFKLLFNAGVAALIFPLHSLFETKLKGRLVKRK